MSESNTIERLADLIRANEEFREAKPCFVSIYRTEQCYGGPEEGGWWYDVTVLDGSVPFASHEAAEEWMEAAKSQVETINAEEQPDRNRAMANLPDIETAYHDEGYIPQGWGDGGKLWITIEDKAGESDNSREPRPHYE